MPGPRRTNQLLTWRAKFDHTCCNCFQYQSREIQVAFLRRSYYSIILFCLLNENSDMNNASQKSSQESPEPDLHSTLSAMTLDKLRETARALDISGFSKLNKSALIDLLLKHHDALCKHLFPSWWKEHADHVYGVASVAGAILGVVSLLKTTSAPQDKDRHLDTIMGYVEEKLSADPTKISDPLEYYDELVHILTIVVEEEQRTEFAGFLAGALMRRGDVYFYSENYAHAVQDLFRSRLLLKQLVEEHHEEHLLGHLVYTQKQLALSYYKLASALDETVDPKEQILLLTQSLQLYGEVNEKYEENKWLETCAHILVMRSKLFIGQKDYEQALKDLTQAIYCYYILEKSGTAITARQDHIQTLFLFAVESWRNDHNSENTLLSLRKAKGIYRKLMEDGESVGDPVLFWHVHNTLSDELSKRNDLDSAIEVLEECVAFHTQRFGTIRTDSLDKVYVDGLLNLASLYRARVSNITNPSRPRQQGIDSVSTMDRKGFFDLFLKNFRESRSEGGRRVSGMRDMEDLRTIHHDLTKARDIYHKLVYNMGLDSEDNLKSLAQVYRNLGVYYIEMDDPTSAIETFKSALKVSHDPELKQELNEILQNLAPRR